MDSLVTAVITTYGRKPELLKRALESALNQTYKNIEVIVSDDNGLNTEIQKEVASFIESYSDRVKYIPLKKNSGACVARNAGLEVAKGEYIAFLDDDDEWVDCKIEEQVRCFNDNPNFGMVYCDDVNIYDDIGKQQVRKRNNPESQNFFDHLMWANFIGGTSIPMMKTELVRELGGFDPLMQSSQDYDMWIRVAKVAEIGYVPKTLVRYYSHRDERITNNPKKKISGTERLLEKNREYADSHPRIAHRGYWATIPYYIMDGRRGTAIRKWVKMTTKYPKFMKMNLKYFFIIFLPKKAVAERLARSTRM
ncbi:MAG: glycosyltransferase [Lachnospiraceae bacterium]|nr:glycosyltransferase [Lachnospiraceae bacterium]